MTETPPDVTVGWVTPDEAERHWPDAAHLDEETLTDLLLAAHEQCVEFLNGREPTPLLRRHRLAQIMQARALARSTSAGSGDQIGVDGLTVTVFPMDWTVKNLLRPRRGRRGPR